MSNGYNQQNEEENEIFQYGDPGIASGHAKKPRWLVISYWVITIWGLLWLVLFWNGDMRWFDRGYWHQLQKAANTTYPSRNLTFPEPPQKH